MASVVALAKAVAVAFHFFSTPFSIITKPANLSADMSAAEGILGSTLKYCFLGGTSTCSRGNTGYLSGTTARHTFLSISLF